jgi:hypothetical protein
MDNVKRAYILTHGVSGIDWKHYKHPLPENVMMCIGGIGETCSSINKM